MMTRTSFPMDDPLSLALRPPAHESAIERAERLRREVEARQTSDAIDKRLREEALKKKKESAGEYKMLLLGQAAAGKTTILKQMRLLYSPQDHEKERKCWKSIIHLNLITSLRILLEALDASQADSAGSSDESYESDHNMVLKRASSPRSKILVSSSNRISLEKLRLAPILSLEKDLRKELGAFSEAEDLGGKEGMWNPRMPLSPAPRQDNILLRPGWQERLIAFARKSVSSPDSENRQARSESPSRAGSVTSARLGKESSLSAVDGGSSSSGLGTQLAPEATKHSDPEHLLCVLKMDVVKLWSDPRCRKLNKKGKLDAADATGYFLDNYERICQNDYQPTDEDILHARVRTVGITEDRFKVERHLVYRIYDVGGSRSQRTAWASFFDDAQAIIFLAPISAFDQVLVEDPAVNRVVDSMALFEQIVGNPLLRDAALILFLNKIDLLERKLRQGIQLSTYFEDYDGDNDFEAVWRWFRAKFRAIVSSKRSVAPKRPVYVHTTIATSTKQIKAILMSVNDTILRDNLRATGLVG